jgi:hypothetical protein
MSRSSRTGRVTPAGLWICAAPVRLENFKGCEGDREAALGHRVGEKAHLGVEEDLGAVHLRGVSAELSILVGASVGAQP